MASKNLSIDKENCIWCRTRGNYNLEHIIPEALGCPEWFVLRDGVCESCNSANGTLDNALVKALELFPFLFNIPKKGGKPPSIATHSSFAGYYDETRPRLFVNREKYKVELPTGKKLGPTNKRDAIQNFQHEELPDGRLQVTLNFNIMVNRSAVRALFKIALEVVAFQVGLDVVRGPQFDQIRDFVRNDIGSYRALLKPSTQFDELTDRVQVGAELNDDGTGAVWLSLLGHMFICDFDPECRNCTNLIACGVLTGNRYEGLPNV